MHAKFDRVVMGARQDGVSLSENISLVPSDDKEVAEMMREIILNAYESPRYRTDENIQRAIQDFENEVYLDCYRTFVAGPDGGR